MNGILKKTIASLVALGGTAFLMPAQQAFAGEGTYHFGIAKATTLLDGSSINKNTAIMSCGNMLYSSPNAWWDRMDFFGESSNVNSYLSQHYPNVSTGVYTVYFLFHSPDSAETVSGINPGSTSPASIPSVGWIFDEVPAFGAYIDIIANALNAASIAIDDNTNTNYQVHWKNVGTQYNVPGSTTPNDAAANYHGYSQRFSVVGSSGRQVQNVGYITYQSSYYYSNNPNLVYWSYDDSGDISSTMTLGSDGGY